LKPKALGAEPTGTTRATTDASVGSGANNDRHAGSDVLRHRFYPQHWHYGRDRERRIPVPQLYDGKLGVPVLALLLSLAAADRTAAQTATPAANSVAPDPRECVIEPAPIEEITAVLATPVAETADSTTPFVPLAGAPAGAEMSAGVVAALREVFACANAGDPLRVASLYTDDFLRDFFGAVPREDLLDFLATPPQPLPEDQKRIIVRIGEVQRLPDARAGGIIVLDEPDDVRREEPDFDMLEHVNGRWLVDEIHEDGGAASTPAIGTPAA
jgi:hypothetical protein